MTANPFAPARSIALADEVRTDLETARAKLVAIGATELEIGEFVVNWDRFEEGVWTPEIRAEWLNMPDVELRADLKATRLEYELSTTTEEEQAERDELRRQRSLRDEAGGMLGSNIPRILEWVGQDPERAAMVFELESTPDVGGNRKTLLEAVAPLAEQFELDDVDEDLS